MVKVITATESLAKRGLTMLRAKRAIEHMLEKGETIVDVPTVENLAVLSEELADAGVSSTLISTAPLDVRAVRERLGLSQEQFARRYNLELDAVQNWEQGRRTPDRTVQSYLRVISAYPDIAAKAQEEPETVD
jgi:DNA-binding transcriptional regulator YiaG